MEFFGGEALISTQFFRGKLIFFRGMTQFFRGECNFSQSSGVRRKGKSLTGGVWILNAVAQFDTGSYFLKNISKKHSVHLGE